MYKVILYISPHLNVKVVACSKTTQATVTPHPRYVESPGKKKKRKKERNLNKERKKLKGKKKERTKLKERMKEIKKET